MIDLQQYINSQLQGSSVIDDAIAQVFGASPIDIKLKEIGYLLETQNGILNFEYYFDPRCLVYKYRASYDDYEYYGVITDEVLRHKLTGIIVQEIVRDIIFKPIYDGDPEYRFENENEQAMLDAAMDYGFI